MSIMTDYAWFFHDVLGIFENYIKIQSLKINKLLFGHEQNKPKCAVIH